MNECLVTKLKSSVYDENFSLKYFDGIRLFINTSSLQNYNYALEIESLTNGILIGGNGTVLKCLSNCYILDETMGTHLSEYTQGVNRRMMLKPIDTTKYMVCLVCGIDKISSLFSLNHTFSSISSLDTDMFKYISFEPKTFFYVMNSPDGYEYTDISYINDLENLSEITRIDFPIIASKNIKGDIACLRKFNNLTTLNNLSSMPELYGDISIFNNMNNLSALDVNNTNISGNIESLGNLMNITSIRVYRTKVYGSIEGLVNAFIANGRTSGTLTRVNLYASQVTYKNVVPSGNYTLTWDENANITWTAS